MISELKLIEKIKKWIPRELQAEIPIGDDAAVFPVPAGKKLVYTIDSIVEGVDFLRSGQKLGVLSAEEIGHKALAINLSDLAAMGAEPYACVLSLGIPKNYSESWIRSFYKGFVSLASEFKVLCAGGDLSQSQNFFASVALIGFGDPKKIVSRSGAKPGDWIAVTGALGGSLLGKHGRFQPRLKPSHFLVQRFKPNSMIDISDGLLQDLGHILENSKVGADLNLAEIPISQSAVTRAKGNPLKALEHACTDGEDFELLFTISSDLKVKLDKVWPKKFPKLPLSWVGRIQKQKGIRWNCLGKAMQAPQFKKSGFQHFN